MGIEQGFEFECRLSGLPMGSGIVVFVSQEASYLSYCCEQTLNLLHI
jgi:hypothetical protein